MAKLTDKQREALWQIMIGAGCSHEWLMQKGEYLCDNIASLIERSQPVERPQSVHHSLPPHNSSSSSDYGIGIATGLVIGSMF